MNFITIDDLNKCIYRNLKKLPRDIDLVVGIPRSGTIVGGLIALYLNLPYTDIDNYLQRGDFQGGGNTRRLASWIRSIGDAQKVLVVDDSISSGRAMREARQRIRKSRMPAAHKYLAAYALETNIHMVDIYFEICHMPRMFEWNYMHHWCLEYACMDIDGVLCEEPSILENDDGPRYRRFLKNARPRIIPTKKVAYIVTGRLEKYRKETEGWLAKNGIAYGQLVMMDLESGAQRRKQGNHAAYKAGVFRDTKCSIFIESSYEQAVEICRLSGKQVFCTDKNVLLTPEGLDRHIKILLNDWRFTGRRAARKLLRKI